MKFILTEVLGKGDNSWRMLPASELTLAASATRSSVSQKHKGLGLGAAICSLDGIREGDILNFFMYPLNCKGKLPLGFA
jgi:hypothetical protein